MNIAYHGSMQPCNDSDKFIISNYLHLTGNKQPNGKYLCPNCGKCNLSINNNGYEYNCYSCHETNKIAYLLRKKNGEFNGSSSTSSSTQNKPVTSYSSKSSSTSSSTATETNKSKKKSLKDIVQFVDKAFPNLRYNLIERELWIGDRPFREVVGDIDECHVWVYREYGIEMPKTNLIDALNQKGKKNQFNPIKEHLINLSNQLDFSYSQAKSIISSVATKYLKTDNPLYDAYLEKWGLGTVARVFKPGCLLRCVPVLQGEQGIGKTSFFSIWGGDWFSESIASIVRVTDQLQIAYRAWIIEAGEIDGYLRKREQGEVKRQLSTRVDEFRLPYARNPLKLKRHFAFCGTTNETEFLLDTTGNDRFWVIRVPEMIDLDTWETERDIVLGAFTIVLQHELEIEYGTSDIWTGKLFALPKNLWAANRENTKLAEVQHPWVEILTTTVEYELAVYGNVASQSIRDQLKIADIDSGHYRKDIKTTMEGGFNLRSASIRRDGAVIRGWIPAKSNVT